MHWSKSAVLWAAMAAVALPAPMLHAASAAGQVGVSAESTAEAVQKDLLQQQAILNAADSTPAAREQAAKKLVSRSSREADQILLGTLTNYQGFQPLQAQLAVAKALIDDPTPEASFITPLANLMGRDKALTEAAAQALAAFKTDNRARARLTDFALDASQPPPSRVAVVRALGKLVDKQTAGTLIARLEDPNENPLVRTAAMEALVEMTGLTNLDDVQQWHQWWNENRNRPDAEWTRDLLEKNARRASELNKRLEQTRGRLADFIKSEYQDASVRTDAEKVARDKRLIDHLKSTVEDERLAALQVVEFEIAQYGSPRISSAVMDAIQQMIGDSATAVRAEVARTLNDPSAVDALLTQLSQEKESSVVEAILQALGRLHDIRAVDPLLVRLNDPSFAVARAAADALRDLAPTLRNEKKTAELVKVAAALRARWDVTPRDTATIRLRESLVWAMASTGDPSLRDVFYGLLRPGQESAEVRKWALRGLGQIGNPGSANIILGQLDDPDRTVRLAAAEALSTTASFAHAQEIGRHLSEAVEKDPDVRDQVWKVLSGLFEKATAGELVYWQDLFSGNDPVSLARRLVVLKVREAKLEAAHDERLLALLQQDLATTQLGLNKADDAIVSLQAALAYWTSHNATEAQINLPRQLLLKAYLQARKYADATAYATAQINSNNGVASDMWFVVKGEIDRLEKNRETENALAMIDTVKKVPWGSIYGPMLEQQELRLKAKANAGGAIWVRKPRRFEHAAAGQIVLG